MCVCVLHLYVRAGGTQMRATLGSGFKYELDSEVHICICAHVMGFGGRGADSTEVNACLCIHVYVHSRILHIFGHGPVYITCS